MTLKVLPLSKEREAWHDPPIPDIVFSKSYSFNSLVWGIFFNFFNLPPCTAEPEILEI